MNRLDRKYAAEIALASTRIMVNALKQTNMRRTALYHCREAQSLRRQLQEA